MLYFPYPLGWVCDIMGILDHRWGECPFQDRVWAQVSGLDPLKSARRYFLVLQAFIDDSSSPGGAYVIAGYVATAERWASFSNDWARLLPTHGVLSADNSYHFKMNEMAANSERMARVPAFSHVIDQHLRISVSCRLSVSNFEAALRRIYTPNMVVDQDKRLLNPYMLAFNALLKALQKTAIGLLNCSPRVRRLISISTTKPKRPELSHSGRSMCPNFPTKLQKDLALLLGLRTIRNSYRYRRRISWRGGFESGMMKVETTLLPLGASGCISQALRTTIGTT